MNEVKIVECADKDCTVRFKKFNSLRKYCSPNCQNKNKKPNLKLKSLKPINKVSDKRKIENLKYTAQRIVFLGKPENQICPITGWPTTDVHHQRGRVGSLFLDETYWIALSREGHQHVEENPEWAKENGYSLDRLSKN
jgi:hypothetical protein